MSRFLKLSIIWQEDEAMRSGTPSFIPHVLTVPSSDALARIEVPVATDSTMSLCAAKTSWRDK